MEIAFREVLGQWTKARDELERCRRWLASSRQDTSNAQDALTMSYVETRLLEEFLTHYVDSGDMPFDISCQVRDMIALVERERKGGHNVS